MGRILLIENNPLDVELVTQQLRGHLDEAREVETLLAKPQSKRHCLGIEDADLSDLDLVLLDLELSITSDQPPGDLLGREVALPCLRSRARWIPVILVSRYLDKDSLLVANSSPFGFDGLLPKRALTNLAFNRTMWDDLIRRASLNRVAALTGRDIFALEDAMAGDMSLSYGSTIANQIDQVGEETLKNLLKLAGFSRGQVAIEHLEQGYSGSLVMRALCRRGNREANWLLKVSQDKAKLNRELVRHRQVQLDGITRRITVPPLWGAPIVWGSSALIAYEFERDSRSLLELIQDVGIQDGLSRIRGALEDLYEGCTAESVIPTAELSKVMGNQVPIRGIPEQSLLYALSTARPSNSLDQAAKILCGCHHGDLHSRNILVSDSGVALIDFAHYVAHSVEGTTRGIPLLDLAKLAVDLWINKVGPGPGVLLSVDALVSDDFKPIVDLFFVNQGPKRDEVRFFTAAVECLMGRYLLYPNLPKNVDQNIKRGLKRHYKSN